MASPLAFDIAAQKRLEESEHTQGAAQSPGINAAGSQEKTRMRLLAWGINYGPEMTGIAPCNVRLCEGLAAKGHSVEMVTSFTYYPAWRRLPEDEGAVYRTDRINGIPVHRCWLYVPEKVSAMKRILHEASFVGSSFLRILSLPAPDAYIVVSPPLLLGVAAWLAARIKGAPFVFHVQDLQPDAALGLGMLKPNTFARLLYLLERVAYIKAARVSGITQGMLERFRQKGVPSPKLIYFPNSVDRLDSQAIPARGEFRRRNGIRPEEFLAVYSGNLGVKQGIEIIVDAAKAFKNGKVRVVICGEGSQRQKLEDMIAKSGVENRVMLLPLQETKSYHEMLADADVCLITQQRGSGRSFFPSKLLSALAFGKPVVTVAEEESELYRAHKDGGFGPNVPPDHPEELAKALEDLAGSPQLMPKYGHAAGSFIKQFETGHVLDSFEQSLLAVLHSK